MYEKKLTCDMISNLYDCNHGNLILACMQLKVILYEVACKIFYKYVSKF